MLFHRPNDPQHGDKEQEHPTGGDASYDGQTGDYAGELAWKRGNRVTKKYFDFRIDDALTVSGDSNDYKGHQHIDDI